MGLNPVIHASTNLVAEMQVADERPGDKRNRPQGQAEDEEVGAAKPPPPMASTSDGNQMEARSLLCCAPPHGTVPYDVT